MSGAVLDRVSLQRVRRELEARQAPTRSGDAFVTLCPSHADSTPSLSVRWVSRPDGGLTLLHCHACQAPAGDIANDLGLTMADLYDDPPRTREYTPLIGRSVAQRRSGTRRGRLGRLPAPVTRGPAQPEDHQWSQVATYPYTDTDGVLVQQVIREVCTSCEISHKRFRQMWTGAGRMLTRKPAGFTPVLYRMPEVAPAIAAGEPVWLMEGEKDADTAAQQGLTATTNAQGAGAFPDSLAAALSGADVRVVLDRDEAGYKRGIQLVGLLTGVAKDVRLFLPATQAAKSDFFDHVQAGHAVADLIEVPLAHLKLWAGVEQARNQERKVEQALSETMAHLALAEAAQTQKSATEHRRLALRWTAEAEMRWERLRDEVTRLREAGGQTTGRWPAAAVTAAGELLARATTAALSAHQASGAPISASLAGAGSPPDSGSPDRDPALEADQVSGSAPIPAEPGSPSTDRKYTPSDRIRGRRFSITDGRIVEEIPARDGGEPTLRIILGIDLRIAEFEVIEDTTTIDDVDTPTLLGRDKLAILTAPPTPEVVAVTLTYTDPGSREQMRIRVPYEDYLTGRFLEALPGGPDHDSKPAGIAKVRDALRAVSGHVPHITRYRSTGWRRNGEEWMFIHARGAIGPTGTNPAPVLLTGPLTRFDLPDPSGDPSVLRAAFLADSAGLLTALPDRVAAPLLGHVYRSALGPNPWLLTLVGSPGSYKTSIASLAMHHWGELWDRRKPASSMSGNGDTLNALRIKLHSAKDALYWADDVAPTKDWGNAQRILEEFARLVHNGEQRSRATRDGLGILDGTPPRASAMVTSEVMPRPGSGAQRMLIVPISAEDVELDDIINLDTDPSRHGRALLMASYLRWLAQDLPKRRQTAFTQAADFAAALRGEGENVRQAEAISCAWAGWISMTDYLVEARAITPDEQTNILWRINHALIEAAEATNDPDLPTSTGARVRELIAHALRTGIAYVEDVRTGEAPPWPLASRLGWRQINTGTDDLGRPRHRIDARGIRFGYVLHDPKPGEPAQLLVESAALEQVLRAAALGMNDAPQIDRGTAVRALHDDGVLIPEQRTGRGPRYTVWRTLHCEDRRQRVTALLLDRILPNQHPDDPPPPPAADYSWPEGPQPGSLGGAPTAPKPAAAPRLTPRRVGEPTIIDVRTPRPDQPVTPTQPADRGVSTQPPQTKQTQQTSQTAQAPKFDPHPVPQPREDASPADDFPTSVTPTGNQPVPDHHQPDRTQPGTDQAPAGPRPATAPTPPASQSPNIPPTTRAGTQAPPAVPTATFQAPTQQSPNVQPPKVQAPPAVVVTPRVTPFRAAAAVIDTDGIWCSNGEHLPLPQLPNHLGDLVALNNHLHLGTRLNTPAALTEGGQLWIGDQLARHMGIDMDTIHQTPPTRRDTTIKELTTGCPAVTNALTAGYHIGGEGDRMGLWTRVWKGPDKALWVVLRAALDDQTHMPLVAGDPDHETLARRIGLLTHHLGYPYKLSPQTTGLDLAKALRWRDHQRLFAIHDPVEPATLPVEADLNWTRKPTTQELTEHQWVHAYDRSGSYLAGLAGLDLGVGEATHHPKGTPFDPKTPGYWRIEIPEHGDWRYPNPLDPLGNTVGRIRWVTTPTLALATELDLNPEILEAYTWTQRARVFDSWYTRIRNARTALDTGDPDAHAAREQLKTIYTQTIGMIGSHQYMNGRRMYAPERRHAIIAKARANITRRILQIGHNTGRWPVAVMTDTIIYTSPDPNPVTAWPGHPDWLGRDLGRYKPEGTLPLDQHAQFLTGGQYRGKDLIRGAN